MNRPDIESGLQNLSELLSMKDQHKYTTIETSLMRFIEEYFAQDS